MLEVLIYNIFAVWRACLSTDSLQSYAYQLCSSSQRLLPLFAQGRLHTCASKKLARPFNLTFHYTDDVLLLNNYTIGDFVVSIYVVELGIKDTTDTATVM